MDDMQTNVSNHNDEDRAMREFSLYVGGRSFTVRLHVPAPFSTTESGSLKPREVVPKLVRAVETGAWGCAAEEAGALAARLFRLACATRVKVAPGAFDRILQTSIALSGELEEGTYALDRNGRVVLPNDWALAQDWDCDGDPVTELAFGDSGMIVKMPPKKLFPVLERVELPEPILRGISRSRAEEMAARTLPESKDSEWAAMKAFALLPLGQITRRWWSVMLKAAADSQLPLDEAVAEAVEAYGDAYREDLEGRSMKARTKGGDIAEAACFGMEIGAAAGATGVAYGTAGSRKGLEASDWNGDHMAALVARDRRAFRFGKPRKRGKQDPVAAGWSRMPQIGAANLPELLVAAGLMRVERLAPSRKQLPDGRPMPPAVVVQLWCPTVNEPVALTWTKDAGSQRSGYAAVLYPTWACEVVKVRMPDGVETHMGSNRVMDPLEHMGLWLSRHFQSDLEIRSIAYVKKMWEVAPGKVRALEAAIREYVSLYGEGLPGTKGADGRYTLTRFGAYFAQRSATVDHQSIPQWDKDWCADLMLRATKKAGEAFGGLHWPAFSSANRGVRRHFLAEADGLPDFVRRDHHLPCQPHRPGRNRSLLCRGVASLKATVAVVDNGSCIQALITPSGIAKSQPEVDVFLPDTSPEEVEGWEMVPFYSWLGEVRHVWVSPSAGKRSKKVGKFVCAAGSRFEPREFQQCWASGTASHDGKPVDVVMPIAELESKNLEGAFLSRAERGVLVLEDGSIVKDAWFLTWNFVRSGAASENVEPRSLQSWRLGGFLSLMLSASCHKAGRWCSRGSERALDEALEAAALAQAAQFEAEAAKYGY